MRHSVKLVANDNNEFWGELFVGKVCDRGRKCKLWECIWQSGKVLSLSFNMVCGVGRKCSAFNGWEAISLKKDEFHLKLRSEQYIHGRNDIDKGVWESIITGEIREIISTNSLGEITWPEAYKFGGKKNKKDNWQGDFTPTTTRRIMDTWALHDTICDLKHSGLLWDNIPLLLFLYELETEATRVWFSFSSGWRGRRGDSLRMEETRNQMINSIPKVIMGEWGYSPKNVIKLEAA